MAGFFAGLGAANAASGGFLQSMGQSLLGGAVSSIFGGKSKGPQLNLKERRKLAANELRGIVEGAQAAGFNPLTVLRSGAGRDTSGMAITSPLTARAAIAETMGDAIMAYDPIAQESGRLDNEIKQRQIEAYDKKVMRGVQSTTGGNSEEVGPNSPEVVNEDVTPPWQQSRTDDGRMLRPQSRTGQRVRVKLPYGGVAHLPRDVAERNNVRHNSNMDVGNLAEIFGEVLGEGSAALQPHNVARTLGDMGLLTDAEGNSLSARDLFQMFGLGGGDATVNPTLTPRGTTGSGARRNRGGS